MEQALHAGFGDVRIHADAEADRLGRSLQAAAFSVGPDLYFRRGLYRPDSAQGVHLLAHELHHATEPLGSPAVIRRVGESDTSAVRVEQEGALDKEAEADPREFMKTRAGSSWANVLSMYKDKELTWVKDGDHEGRLVTEGANRGRGMNALLAFRLRETLLAKDPVDGALPPKSIMRSVKEELNDPSLAWNYGEGSATPTSDIDSNLSGRDTGRAVQLFNEKFRKSWGQESGYVFDVNVYARDYLPSGKLGELNEKFHVKNRRGPQRHLSYAEIMALKQPETGPVRFDLDLRSEDLIQADLASEEVYALLKIRMSLNDSEWRAFSLSQLGALPHAIGTSSVTAASSLEAQATLGERLMKAQRLFENREKTIRDKMGHQTQEPEVRMAAENRLYEEKLESVEQLRAALRSAEESPCFIPKVVVELLNSHSRRIASIRFHLKQALYESSMYANEAYITNAAVLHVVANKQILSTKKKSMLEEKKLLNQRVSSETALSDEEKAKKKAAEGNLKIKLSAAEYLHSFYEQLGWIFKDLDLYGKAPRGSPGAALLKASKYFYRIANAAKHIYRLGEIDPPEIHKLIHVFAKEAFQQKAQASPDTRMLFNLWNRSFAEDVTLESIRRRLLEYAASVRSAVRV